MGLGILWQVAEHAGRADGEAVIHVCEPGAIVLVDGYEYPAIPRPGDPIVYPLRPGSHTLSMTREDRVLYQETFTLDPGETIVLTAHDQTRPAQPTKNQPPRGPNFIRHSDTVASRPSSHP